MNLLQFSWKDFKNQKVRSTLGVSGIMISVLLLSSVSIMIDSMSFSYLDMSTSQMGSADIMFTNSLSTDLSLENLYMDQNYLEEQLVGINEIDYFYPRIMTIGYALPNNTDIESTMVQLIGLNTTLEQNSGSMGDLLICDPTTYEITTTIFEGPIPEGHCIIMDNTAKKFNLTVGDTIEITETKHVENFTIDAIVEQNQRFSMAEVVLYPIIIELDILQTFLDEEGKVNYIFATLVNREMIYDSRDIDATVERIRKIGEKIQEKIGLDYQISMPKMQGLEMSEMITMAMSMMMVFISLLSMLISGILINSILTTSVEERIREFGVMRVIGGKGHQNVIMVILQGGIMGFFGTIIGIGVSLLAVPAIMESTFESLLGSSGFFSSGIEFVVLPQTIIQNFLIGMVVSLIISTLPALKAGKIKITNAIDPFRHDAEEAYTIKKEGSPNTKIMLFGMAISTIGFLIFVLFPQIIITMDLGLIISLFIVLMLAVLIGMVFAFMGIVPAVQWLILQFFRPVVKKYYRIILLSLKRNRRRNSGNSLMFSLTFSFIFFMSSFITIQEEMTKVQMEFTYGADLNIINQGSLNGEDSIDLEFVESFSQLDGISQTAPILHNTMDMVELFSILALSQEEDVNMEEIGERLFSMFSGNEKYSTYIGSKSYFNYDQCSLFGVDSGYVNITDEEQFVWDSISGSNKDTCFNALFDSSKNNTVIISKNIADHIGVTQLGQEVRMVFVGENQTHTDANATTMIVVGISAGMPALNNFKASSLMRQNAGVMMSIENYLLWMDQGSIDNKSTPIDKILFNLDSHTEESISNAKETINDLYGDDYSFSVEDNISIQEMMNSGNEEMDFMMQSVLMLTVLISLFGLISTMYSTLLERMFEVGLLRSMGLKTRSVRMMFIVESLVMMIGAGTMGLFIGTTIAYLMVSNVAIITEMPTPFVIDLITMSRTYLLAISVCVLGVILITRKIGKWSIMDIFRSSF
ncbi:MAG: ABC transporter permease [archaeon]|nr:ABC transporter permease [archaeon]